MRIFNPARARASHTHPFATTGGLWPTASAGTDSARMRALRPWYRRGWQTAGFQSPTGNIRCALEANDSTHLLCEALNNQNAVDLSASAAADMSIAATIPSATTLSYGRVWSGADFYCWSRFTAVTCRSLYSRNGFAINRAGIQALDWPGSVLDAEGNAVGGEATDAPSSTQASRTGGSASSGQSCYGGYTIPAVHLAAVHIPGQTIPATTIGGIHYPAQKLPPVDIPGQTIPAHRVPRECFSPTEVSGTTVRVRNYGQIDPLFDAGLTGSYWDSSAYATVPDFAAPGFGGFNAAGFPKSQYVRPYFRRDGTFVNGYWRNSPSDGLPTCHIISC
jgi:hypothetical protein